jgi:hypothetical protein
MVAELTLFLSSDDEIQVRVHTTKSGICVFCVRDFVRMVSNKDMGYEGSTLYWLTACCSRELRTEHAIMDQYPARFLGAYEPDHICISAEGLLLLLSKMQSDGMARETYAEEIKQRLLTMVEGGGSEYMREFDDGEVDEMMAAKDAAIAKGEGLNGPPEDWKFFHDDGGAVDKDTELKTEAQLQKVMEAVNEMRILSESGEGQSARTTKKTGKLDKRTAFSIKDLIRELELQVDSKDVPIMCKTVCTRFRQMCPGSEMFSRQRQTYFYTHDRECLEGLVREEYTKRIVKKVELDFNRDD